MTITTHDPSDITARKERAVMLSLVASICLTILKLIAGLLAGSLALLSEAGNAALDIGTILITWFAVRVSGKPADDVHHYGHGKVESLAALVQTALLFVLAAWVVVAAIGHLLQGGVEVEPTALTFGVLIVSIVIDVTRWRSLSRLAKETDSHALAADALNFGSDIASSSLVLLGLVAALFGFHYGDALAALGVAAFIGVAGFRLGRSTIDHLTDAAPKGSAELVRSLVGDVPGVVEVRELRLRPVGAQLFGDLEIAVSRTLPQDRVASIKAAARERVREEFPQAEVTITTVPVALDNETVLDRVMLIAARRHALVHHVTIQNLGETLSIGLDLEVDGRMSLGAAHVVASNLEAAIRDEFGPSVEVDTHIEPLEVEELSGQDAGADIIDEVAFTLHDQAAKTPIVKDIHAVRVRETPSGLVVNYHCRIDPALDVARVHEAIDLLERRVRAAHPAICRVVGHTDPREMN